MDLIRFLVIALLLLPSLAMAEEPESGLPETVSYHSDVRPIFQQHCQGCHQPAKKGGGFLMTGFQDLFQQGDSEEAGIVAGKPDESLILAMISGGEPSMPKESDPLSKREVDLIRKWIEQGAKDDSPADSGPVIDMQHPPKYELPPVLTSVDYSADGKLLAVSGYHEVLLYNTADWTVAARLVGLSERIESAKFSPDGKRLAVTGGSPGRFGELQVWDVEAKQLQLSVPVSYDTIYGVSWSPDGKLIAFGCADNTLRAVDSTTGKQALFQGAHEDWVLETVFSKDGSHLISVSRDRSTKLTQVETERFVDNITSITPGALKGGLITVDRHPEKDEIVVGGADGTPKLYQIYRTQARKIGDDYNRLKTFPAMPGRVFSVTFSKDGKWIAAGSSSDGKGEVRVFNYEDAKQLSVCEGEAGPVYDVAFSPDNSQVASVGFDGMVRINDAATGKLLQEFTAVPLENTTAAAN